MPIAPLTEAQGRLVADHARLAAYWARTMADGDPWLRDEYHDAGLDGLMIAAARFRHGAFRRYAAASIIRRIRRRQVYLAWPKRDRRRLVPMQWPHLADETVGPKLTDDSPDFERLIARLRPRDRVVMRLRFADDLNQSDVARRLGVTRTRAQQIESRILATLRRTLRHD